MKAKMTEQVNHPTHYNENPSGIECIDVVRHMNFNRGNVVKYVWRAGAKANPGESQEEAEIRDLEKALWYLEDEIARMRSVVSPMETEVEE